MRQYVLGQDPMCRLELMHLRRVRLQKVIK